jgi:L-rhamnose mutarotase
MYNKIQEYFAAKTAFSGLRECLWYYWDIDYDSSKIRPHSSPLDWWNTMMSCLLHSADNSTTPTTRAKETSGLAFVHFEHRK